MPRTIIQVQYLVTVSCSSNQLSASNPHMGYFVIDKIFVKIKPLLS